MKYVKNAFILLILLSFFSSSALAWGGKKRPPQAMNIEYVQYHLAEVFK